MYASVFTARLGLRLESRQMMDVQQFCYTASWRVMQGLQQELKISPYAHYSPSGYNSARVMTLKLNGINPHYLQQISGLSDQLTMWAGLDDKSKIRIGFQQNKILIEIPKPPGYWKQVTIEAMEQRHMIRRGPIATIGMGLQDDPKRINFKEEALAHVFITGQTRSGKTNTQKLIGWNVARNTTPNDCQMVIFDVAKRGYKWSDFANVSNLAHPVITNVPEAESALGWLAGEIERRADRHYTEPRLFCLIDELKALIDDSDQAERHLSRIASVGGEFGLHLILATQYPQIKMLGSAEIKRNITTRLCGKVDDANSAANALGIAGSGADTLQGYGDFLLKDFDGLSRLTVAKVEKYHIEKLPRGATNRLPLADDMPVVRPIAQSAKKMPTPEEMAVIIYNWDSEHIPGIQKIKGLLGGRDDTNKRRRSWAGRFIIQMQKLTSPGECVDFHQKSLREYGG